MRRRLREFVFNREQCGDMRLSSISATGSRNFSSFWLYLGHFTDSSVGEGPFRTSTAPDAFRNTSIDPDQPVPVQSLRQTMKISTTPARAATIVHHYRPETWVSSLSQFVSQAQNQDSGRSWRQNPSLSGRTLRIVLGVTLAAACLPRALSAVHPVPLDPKTDSAKCLECHEDKTKGTAVHSAIATGCLSCHQVRVNKDTTRVMLITATPYKLCLSCHSDKDAAQIKGHVHQPAVRDCLTCHDPHTSANKNQLLKATSGEKKENLCLTCHTQGTNVPDKGSRHAALDMGCDTCHVTHKTGADLTPENQFHLTKAAPALCVDCHDPKDAALQKAHHNQPFGTANCLSCHDPHQSAAPKLMAKFTHPPFADRNCELCHAPAKDGKVVLTQS